MNNYFYDLPDDLQNIILDLKEQMEAEDLLMRQLTYLQQRRYNWYIATFCDSERIPTYQEWLNNNKV